MTAPFTPDPLPISGAVARRYLLGRQGLWPGRRWAGKPGAAEAVRALEALQVDPMTVVARSHDLVLWSRVDGYDPAHLDELLYTDRRYFDYGGHLDIYPMEELPYWRLHMRRRLGDERQARFAAERAALLDEVRDAVRERGPLGNRDLAGRERVQSYRGRKDTALALYHLWLTGELMTAGRRGFERLYDLRERVAPPHLGYEAPEAEAERRFAVKALRQLGLATLRAWTSCLTYPLHRKVDRAEARDQMRELLARGEALEVLVEGQRDPHYAPTGDAPLLEALRDGSVPEAWRPLGGDAAEEANFLSPLDNLLARLRTRALFDFEHLWEVYKPAERRRWGYYTMPILYGDRLVGRLDPKLDRKAGTLRLNGFWLEAETTGDDPAFAEALSRGLDRFARFHSARRLDLSAVRPESLRERVRASLGASASFTLEPP
jgi:uncharacterized protein YcaQ